MKKKEVVIIGGGLAGLTAAIHLSKIGIDVTIIEKNEFPKHKVCGEYISNEVIPYLSWLQVNINELHPTIITQLELSLQNGSKIKSQLPLGGFGISRYALDYFLYKKAISNGCKIIKDTAESIDFSNNNFTITTANNLILQSEIVIGAFGKRANLDKYLNRKFVNQKSEWLAVKAHYSGEYPNDLVGLHTFDGGYCGVSKVENNIVNICYIVNYENFKKYKSTTQFELESISKNRHLKHIYANCSLLFEKPLTISQISFDKKCPIENHIIMIGDTAGLIHPLCGNGMAMAIHSAKIASEKIEKYYRSEIKSRTDLEKNYQLNWNHNFKKRLFYGRTIAALLRIPQLSNLFLKILIYFPILLPFIINKTHGKPIKIET